MKRIKYWLLILLGFPKIIFFNLRYFPLSIAIKLPILVTHRVNIKKAKGKVIINGKIKRGMVRIAFADVSISDTKERSLWNVEGTIIFKGIANFGAGCKIAVGKNAELIFGDKFCITAKSEIACFKKIEFGNNCLLSWDILVMDTDSHPVFDVDGNLLNEDKAIKVGNHVWIGCRSLILKGTEIADDCVIAAQSVLTRKFNKSNCILAGQPAQIVKQNVYRSRK